MKHSGINLTNVENLQKLLYRNCIISKETKDLNEWVKSIPHSDTLKVAGNTSQIDLLIQDNSDQSSICLLCRNWEPDPKIHFEKEHSLEGLAPPNFKT